ncbi:glycosyltransferase family 2 protein [Nakamurella sp. GG22]
MTAGDRIGLVTVTYSPGETLDALLDSLPAASTRAIDVVLADNGSTDGSVERAAERPGVRLVRTGSNLGYGAAANAGVAVLDPAIDWVMVINPDVVLGPGAIDRLLEVADRYPTAGAFGPLITTPDGIVYPSARHLPSIGTGVGHALFGWWWPRNPWTRTYRQDSAEPVERTAGWLSGSCLLLRRPAFEAVDGFDPGYFMYFEDVDLGQRLGEAGWSSIYCPSAHAVHVGGHSTERSPGAMAKAHHRSAYRYLSRRYPAWWQAPLRWVLRAGLAARAQLSRRSAKMAAGATLPDRRVG